LTVTIDVPEVVPAAALITTVPAPTAVTIPVPLTFATELLDDDQVTVAGTLVPAEFRGAAENVCAVPTIIVADDGDTVTDATALLVVPPPPVVPPPLPPLLVVSVVPPMLPIVSAPVSHAPRVTAPTMRMRTVLEKERLRDCMVLPAAA